jgi:hypothetical protein
VQTHGTAVCKTARSSNGYFFGPTGLPVTRKIQEIEKMFCPGKDNRPELAAHQTLTSTSTFQYTVTAVSTSTTVINMVRLVNAKPAAVAALFVVILLVALTAPATAVTTTNKFSLALLAANDNEEIQLTDAAKTTSDDSLIELSAVNKNAVATSMADVPQQWSLISKFNSDTGSFVGFTTTLSVVSDLLDSDCICFSHSFFLANNLTGIHHLSDSVLLSL